MAAEGMVSREIYEMLIRAQNYTPTYASCWSGVAHWTSTTVALRLRGDYVVVSEVLPGPASGTDFGPLPPETGQCLTRVLQLWLNNVIRAGEIWLGAGRSLGDLASEDVIANLRQGTLLVHIEWNTHWLTLQSASFAYEP